MQISDLWKLEFKFILAKLCWKLGRNLQNFFSTVLCMISKVDCSRLISLQKIHFNKGASSRHKPRQAGLFNRYACPNCQYYLATTNRTNIQDNTGDNAPLSSLLLIIWGCIHNTFFLCNLWIDQWVGSVSHWRDFLAQCYGIL